MTQLDYPATQRNKHAILDAMREHLPPRGTVLEVASGSGQHAVFFAAELPEITWQPSSKDADERASIAAYRETSGLANLRAPLALDTTASWPIDAADAVFCANMIHIAPWAACEGLFAGAARLLAPGAPLITYGPYKFSGTFTAPSNAAFDESLRSRDASWGVRDVDDLDALATRVGLARETTVALPANNHLIVWRRT